MSWFKGFFSKDEAEQPIATGVSVAPAVATVVANDDAAAPPVASGKKLKLNFKKIPKQVVAEIAAETTGLPQTQQPWDGRDMGTRKGGLSGAFNDAAAQAPKPKMPMTKAPRL